MNRGDRIRLMDGSEAEITDFGFGDFDGEAFPVYMTIVSGENVGTAMAIWSNELKRKENTQ